MPIGTKQILEIATRIGSSAGIIRDTIRQERVEGELDEAEDLMIVLEDLRHMTEHLLILSNETKQPQPTQDKVSRLLSDITKSLSDLDRDGVYFNPEDDDEDDDDEDEDDEDGEDGEDDSEAGM